MVKNRKDKNEQWRKDNRIFALILVCFIIASITSCCALLFSDEPGHPTKVVNSYYEGLGIMGKDRLLYEEFISVYGEPDSIELREPQEGWPVYRIHASFGGMTVIFLANEDELNDSAKWQIGPLTTTDPEHRFGFWEIHVGSTREEVRRAYRKTSFKEESATKDWAIDYTEDHYLVTFTYDENDIVTSIRIEHCF